MKEAYGTDGTKNPQIFSASGSIIKPREMRLAKKIKSNNP
jgi:hypothetical protein